MIALTHRVALAFALVLFAATGFAPLHAQTGTLSGTVIDADFSEGVIGATVVVDGTTLGAATDFDGNYRIPNIPVGTYDVVFSSVGFTTQRITGVEIKAGETKRIDLTMSEDVQLLGEVVVEARLVRNNEAALLRDRQNAAGVSDAISAEAISKSGASDAADAMERVTGASVVGGKFVVVRGLGDRYSNTQLNGASIPTADPDRRSVQFDLFPSNLLENIVTLKTFTPDQPGSFSGGLVDIRTKSFPEAFELRFSASSGFDTQTQFQDGFLFSPGGGNDLLAFDDGTRELPNFFNGTNAIPNPRQARRDPVQAQQLDDISRAFGQTFDMRSGEGPINQSYAASLGNRHDFGTNALGYVLSLNWGRSSDFYDDGRVERYTFNSVDDEGNASIRPQLLLNDSRGTEEVSWGGIANFTYRMGSRNEIGLNSLYSRSAEQQARLLQGFFPEQFDSSQVFVDRALAYTERDLYSLQLRGRHQIPAVSNATVEWMGTYGSNTIDEPDQRFFANTITTRNIGGRDTSFYNLSVVGVNGQSRFFRQTQEDIEGGKLDITVPFDVASRPVQFKFGGRYDRTTRNASERRFDYAFDDVEFGPGEDGLGDVAGFFGQLGVTDTTRFDADGNPTRFQIGSYVVDNSQNQLVLGNNYDADLTVAAGYGQFEVEPFNRLRIIAGARYESTTQDILTQRLDSTVIDAATNDTTRFFARSDKDTRDWLPSVNVVYSLTDNMNLRGAASRTLARPTFLELAPGARVDFALGEQVVGNPDLDRTLITNYDLRWEWFTAPGDIVAASVYYKDFQDPIERVIISNNGTQSFRNVPQAEVLGLELEARQGLGRLLPSLSGTPILRNLNLGVNASFIGSTISIDSTELNFRRGLDPDASDTRALQGQSPFIVNADLAYENFETGTNIGVYFNVFGRRLSRVSLGGTPDVYEESVPQLDFTASQRLPGQFSLKLSVKNILGSDFREVYDVQRADGGDAFFGQRNRGTSFSLGLSYSPRFGGGARATPATPTN